MKYRVALLLFLVFLLPGCGQKKSGAENPDDWKKEVLQMNECGMDGLACCMDRQPSCSFGQECCVDPLDSKRTYCADKCVCGEKGKFCCTDGPKCGDGLVCSNGDCIECGKKGQTCCSDEKCGEDLLCFGGACVSCGDNGAPCCASKEKCNGEKTFGDYRQDCFAGMCDYCGSDARKKCPTEPFCNPNHLLSGDSCLQCGKLNQPCCEKGGVKECDKGLECGVGFCAEKK